MAQQSSGFSEDGSRYIVRDVHVVEQADADLWNDQMVVRIDQRGRVIQAGFLQPNMASYSDPLRAFFIRDDQTGRSWSAPHEPIQARPRTFEFSIGLTDLAWRVERDGIRIELRLVVPRDDALELWTATVVNSGRRRRRLSLYSYLPAGLIGLLAQRSYFDRALGGAIHDYFPYYVQVADYYRLDALRNQVFCAPDTAPDGYELSQRAFVGRAALHNPDGLRLPRLPRRRHPFEVANEPGVSVFQFQRTLAPGKSFTVNFAFGPCKNPADARRLKKKYLSRGGVRKALDRVKRTAAATAPSVRIETPDSEFNHFVNHWLPARTHMLARTIRHNYAPQGRNVIQDAMGGVYTDPKAGRHWFVRIWAHQHTNGWLPHGMPFKNGVQQIPINAIPHKDINSWGPTAILFYVSETGDAAILDERIPFADRKTRKASLYDHIGLGLDWLLKDRTRRGLCRIGQGDWNDPLNMAGRNEKGESIWLTEALVHALESWAIVADARGDRRRAARCRREAAKTRRAINRHAWDGRWYARGFTDAGDAFGVSTAREGRIFLNAQSWAMISGTATPQRAASCIRAVEKHLMSPSGPMTLAPPYAGMRKHIGKLTQKIPGWNENGSVYCHAATFYAYALYTVRDKDKAFDVLRRLLPGTRTNTLERTGQLPLYVPNFFRGTPCGRKAGRSSHNPNTGTAPWYYRTVISMLFGVRAELDGLRIDPQLPSSWKHVRVWRKWRGAEFDITISRSRKITRTTVWLDDATLRGTLVPVQRKGTRHAVRVLVP